MKNEAQHITQSFDVQTVRKDFPILSEKIHGKSLVYLDNGATTHKPLQVIERMVQYYSRENSNVHRGVHLLSEQATLLFENARKTTQEFIHAKYPEEIIFTSGTTESINLLASSFGQRFIQAGDEILISTMEHHSNILPWQRLCEEKSATLKIIPLNEQGEISVTDVEKLLSEKTKILAITHVSNTIGTVNPIKEICALVHKHQIPVMVDGAQSIPHTGIDVQLLDADFFCFSTHKMYGPTGVGVLYGKKEWLEKLPPYKVGGGTIKTVSFSHTEYADLPLRFEAGTPNISGVLGHEAAIQYLKNVGIDNIAAHEHILLTYVLQKLKDLPEITLIGMPAKRAGAISFNISGVHPFDTGTLLNQQGVAVRTGHHCTQPLMQHFGIEGTVRLSVGMYNTEEEIDIFIGALKKAINMLV